MKDSPDDVFGRRLAQARQMRGFSLRDLAERLNGIVSANALNKYELGAMLPTSTVLIALAKNLGQSVDYFFRPFTVELADIEFRKTAKVSTKTEDSIREQATEFFERYLEIEELLCVGQNFEHPIPQNCSIEAPEDIEVAAQSLRKAWKLGIDPIANVIELLEQHGFKIWELEASEGFDGFSGWTGKIPVIVLNNRESIPVPRKRLTALHEVAHLLLKFNPAKFSEKEIERLCHAFAAAVLMLKAVFEHEFGGFRRRISLQELIDLKARYGIAIAAIMARAVRLGLISKEHYRSFCIQSRGAGWIQDEPGAYRGEERPRRFERLLYQASAKELVSESKAAILAGKSLVEFRSTLRVV